MPCVSTVYAPVAKKPVRVIYTGPMPEPDQPAPAGPANTAARARAGREPPLRSPDYAAGLGAVVWPGLGHVLQGRRRRGFLAMAGVLGLFLYGLFVGGIDAVDSQEDRIWFFGAALVGPLAWGTDWVHQNKFKATDPQSNIQRSGYPGEVRDTDASGRAVWRQATPAELEAGMGPPNAKGLGRLNEIAMLSIALAGMLNFIIFLDALIPGRGGKAPPTGAARARAAEGTGG